MAPCPDVLADLHGSAEPLLKTVVEALASLPSCCSRLWVALSGGCDSITLLHCTARALRLLPSSSLELHALHVNHQLQDAAAAFERLCCSTCAEWGVTLHIERVTIDSDADGGPEAQARDARYAAFIKVLRKDDVLWMAHHADDQAETVLQRAMRGSGIAGMAGMPAQRPLGRALLMRPLLAHRQQALGAYARRHGLRWCDDPSNASSQYDRNYLRHQVIPCLSERWPQAVAALGQVAAHAREAHELLEMMADRQLAQWPKAPQQLPINALSTMSDSEARLMIRRALAHQGIPMPPRARLETVLAQLKVGHGHIHWPGGEVRLWQGALYLVANSADGAVLSSATIDAYAQWRVEPLIAGDVSLDVRFVAREGGERLRVNGCRRSIKALFQARGVPPWLRERFRVAWVGETPVALVSDTDAIVADGWHAWRDGTVCGRE